MLKVLLTGHDLQAVSSNIYCILWSSNLPFQYLITNHSLTNLYTYFIIVTYKVNDMKENKCDYDCSDEKTSNCDCNGDNCNANSCCCSSQNHENKSTNPITTTKYMLEKAFYTALMEVQVEKIKKKIESEWGNTLDRTTDVIVQTMTKQWQADVSKLESSKELYRELENIFSKKNHEG